MKTTRAQNLNYIEYLKGIRSGRGIDDDTISMMIYNES